MALQSAINVTNHIGLCYSMAQKHFGGKTPNEDIKAAAMLGVVEASQKFDPENGATFGSYAKHYIQAEISRCKQRNWFPVTYSEHERKILYLFWKAKYKSSLSLEDLSDEEIIDKTPELHSYKERLLLLLSTNTKSLNEPVITSKSAHSDDDAIYLSDALPDEATTEGLFEEKETLAFLVKQIRQALNALHQKDARTHYVIQARKGLDGQEKKTLRELAPELHVSSERVRQIEKEGLEFLRKNLANRFAQNNLEVSDFY